MTPIPLILGILLQAAPPADSNRQKVFAPSGLIEAVEKGEVSKIRGFSSNPGFAEKDKNGRSALVAAGDKGQKTACVELIAVMNERVKNQVSRIITNNTQTEIGQGLTAVAVRMSFFNAADPDGMTPLMYAASHGWQDIVQALLEGGADPSPQDTKGRTAIDHAEAAGYPAIADVLRNPPK